MSYPILYEANATDFFNNGLGTLPDAISSLVTEERNGEFVLDMTYPLHGTRANQIKNNRIIKVDAGHKLTDQRFVIKTVTPAMNTSGQTIITVHAEHVSYLANDLAIKPHLNVNNTTAEQALRLWNGNLTTPNQFTVDSDITTRNNTAWSIDKFQTGRQVLGGVEGSILDVWGGDYRFDNLHVSLLKNRGTIANTLLAYGRNITSFEQENNIIDTYTSVYPFFIQRGDKDKQDTIYTIDNYVVDSSNVNKFPNKSVLPIDVSGELGDIKVGSRPKDSTADDKTEYISVSTLKKRMKSYAQQYINNNNIGVPKVSIKVSFVDLARTSNYADVAPLEQLDLCDEVPVRFSELNIDTTAKVSRIIWNVLTDSYDSIELGEISATLGDKISQVEHSINKTNDRVDQVNNIVQTGADGKSTVFRGQDTPTANHTGDLWYKPNGEDTEMYQWDGVSWHFVMSTKDTHDISDKVDQAMQEMADKEKEINGKLESNQIDISQAQQDINQARQDAADQLADIRKSVAKDIAEAKGQSKDAYDKAVEVDTKADTALENSKDAKETSQSIKADVDTVKGELSSKADKSTVNTIGQTVNNQQTEIKQNANDIKSKAESSVVNKLKGTVETNETLLEQTAQGLTGKADSSQLNKLSGDLTTLSNNFSTTSAGFNASLSKIDDKVDSNKEETDSALSVAKADIKATADNLSTNYTKTTDEHNYVNSQIKESADKINLSVASVSDKVDGIQEWNKNYLTNTSDKEQTVTQSIWGDANELVHDIPQELFGTEITYSLHHISSNHSGYLYINIVDKDGNSSNKRVSGQMHYSADGFIEATFTIPADSQSAKTLGWKYDTAYAGNNLITYSSEKVEKGSKRTDWCPNDADTDSKIAALQIVDDQIKQTVSNKADTSYVDQKADQITSTVGNKADISYVDQQDNKIQSTVASKADASQITQLNDQINLKVSQSDFDNLEIGGRNLLPNSSFESSFGGGWSYSDMSNLFQKDGFIYIKKPNVTNSRTFLTYYVTDMSEYDEGEEYTFSIDFHTSTLDADGGSTSSFVRMLNANGSIIKDGLMSNIDPDKYRNGYTRFSGTGVIQKGTTKLQVTLAISGSVIGSFFVRHAKLEKGNKATDWTPAPEDKVDKDGLVSQINIDKSGVLIQGKKIMIDGDATIKNAVIKSSMIDTLDANKITAGTLNAANVHIINLDVSSLVGDATSFVKSAWNGISDSVMIESGGIAIGSGLEGLALTSSGMHLFERHHGTDVGVISSMSVETYDNVNGLAFALNPNGNFMAWGYRDDYNSNFAQALTFFKSPGGWGRRGFTFSDDVRFDYGIYPAGGDRFNSDMLNINQILLAEDNHWYTGIGNETGETGVFFGKHQLLVKQNGIVYPATGFKIPINIWKSNGAVKEWYNFATGTIESSDIK